MVSKIDLSVGLAGLSLPNPTVLASGIWGTNASLLLRAEKSGAGAVTSKSCSLNPRSGHANPTIVLNDHYCINAVGLSNPGVELEAEEIISAKKMCSVPVIASIFAHSLQDFEAVAQKISLAKPDAIEVNISCPNVSNEGRMFACSTADAASVTVRVKEAVGKIPILVKLSPNVTDIVSVAKSVEDAGADGIVAINTVSGMIIDAYARKPVLTNKFGGVSGPAIKPVALKAVYEISRAVRIPVIGTGGVTTGIDAAEMLLAGASAVGIGTALSFPGRTFGAIVSELESFMSENGYSSIKQLKLDE